MKLIKDPTSDNPYLRKGYANRTAYLKGLAEDFGLTYKKVLTYADMLGEIEDFDALLTILEEVSYLEE